MSKRLCSVESCSAPVQARGWCPAHYERWLRHGDPLADVELAERQRRTMPSHLHDRLEHAAAAEAKARQIVLDLVLEAHGAGGTLREIGRAIGRSHTQVGRMIDRARAGAL